MEPAIEVLSACLPTMGPLLNLRLHLNSLRPPRLLQSFKFRSSSNEESSDSYKLTDFATAGNKNNPQRNQYERKVCDDNSLSYSGETLRTMKSGDIDSGGTRGKLGIHTGGKDANLINEVSAGGPAGVASMGPRGRERQVAQDQMVEDGDDDIFPLTGILVKRDMNWTESKEGNGTSGRREAGGIV